MSRVLVVEDDPTWSMIISGHADSLGREAVVARSPQQAMDALDGGGVELVVLDMLLAAETGMVLLNELRGHGDLAEIPVMVFTGLSGMSAEALQPYGVSLLLDKNTATPDEIRLGMKELLGG